MQNQDGGLLVVFDAVVWFGFGFGLDDPWAWNGYMLMS